MWQDAFKHWNVESFFLHPKAHRAVDALAQNDLLDLSLPLSSLIFRAFEMVSPADVRVVILGQDPYPNKVDAMGLAFSSLAPKPPASLRNIYKELASDLGVPPPCSGDLSHWATQGVLLANTALTVGLDGKSHFAYWSEFTRAWIESLAAHHPLIWILWGKHAQSWKPSIIDNSATKNIAHVIIESPHPSPLSAHRGFFGSRPFSKANYALVNLGLGEVDWMKSL